MKSRSELETGAGACSARFCFRFRLPCSVQVAGGWWLSLYVLDNITLSQTKTESERREKMLCRFVDCFRRCPSVGMCPGDAVAALSLSVADAVQLVSARRSVPSPADSSAFLQSEEKHIFYKPIKEVGL